MIRQHRQPAPVALVVVATVLLGTCAILWILGTVPSGGPDEPAHLVRAAALVRGDLEGERRNGGGEYFQVPAWVGHPDADCFALAGEQPATCATGVGRPVGEASLISTAIDYPVWGHIAPGLATHLPGSVGNLMARVFDAVIPLGLLVAGLALAARRGLLSLGSSALGVTPMAWYSIIVVNPSGLAIAGGFALWAGLLSAEHLIAGRPDRLVAWTIVAGWAAASLPRRDGAVWSALIVTICVAVGVVDLRKLLSRLGIGPTIFLAASIVAAVAWAATSDDTATNALVAAPLLPIAGVAIRAGWKRTSSVGSRLAIVGVLAVGVVIVGVGAVSTRVGGYDELLAQRVIGESGRNIEEAVGLLGWLDTPLPPMALFGWFIVLGILIGVSLLRQQSAAVGLAAGVVGVGILVSWVLELSRGSETGTYFQGRYYLPLLIGVPMILGRPFRRSEAGVATDSHMHQDRMIGSITLATALAVLTVTFGATMRRWAVGILGTNLPWDWDTYGARVPPWVLLLLHALICGALYTLGTRFVAPARPVPPSTSSQPVAAEA